MSRHQRNNKSIKDAIAKRFVDAIEKGMGISVSEASRLLNYANPSTLSAVKNQRSLPDFARLSEFHDQLVNARGHTLNMHWLLTAEGDPFVPPGPQESSSTSQRRRQSEIDDILILILSLDDSQRSALLEFLGEMVRPAKQSTSRH